MSLTDQITADQAAVVAAQAALDAANSQLATDQAALAAVQPHLSLLDQIEGEFTKLESDLQGDLLAGVDKLKVAVLPYIEQMRSLFNA